jgi:microsomal dipeptidase-like Zn-dependent dipeptidase
MTEKNFFADIHLHPTMKAFNSGWPKPQKTVWDYIGAPEPKGNIGKIMKRSTPGIAKYSQSNLYELAKGNVRVAGVSLTPAEKPFLLGNQLGTHLFSKGTKVEMNTVINSFSADSLRFLMDNKDYFKELVMEYRYLYDGQGDSPDGQFCYRLVNNFKEMTETLATDNRTLAITLQIEGAHVLMNEKLLSGKLTHSETKKEIAENIGIIKSWEVPPLSINLCHHFYNGLCGHSRTLSGLPTTLYSQKKGLETGFTGLGINVVKELLSRNNGKRIIIDTKHMSVKGRIEYYKMIRSYNYISEYDKIPVICSHTGVSGYKTMAGGARTVDNAAKVNRNYFYGWNINLSDEEIKIIHETTGLIGIILHKNRLGGGLFFKQHINDVKDEAQIKQAYLRIFMDNILQIVKVLGKPGWDIICLGSDYDGMINHLDPYDKASTLPSLATDLQQFLEQHQYERSMWHGYTPEEIVQKIMCTNMMAFFERHFV